MGAYFAPIITAGGLSVPTYQQILASLITTYRSIYGSTVYLQNDAADYQWISAVALKLNDAMGLCQLAYNARSPVTAIGTDLDSIVKLNGIARLPASFSTVELVLSGTPGTVVINGVIADANGIYWSLPSSVTIGVGGTVNATAVCQQSGAVSANPNTVITPVGGFTAGWTSVTNPAPAVVGLPIEVDSQLRARQSVSVALPSETRLAGTIAGLLKVANVTLINVLENQGSATDGFGNLGHSLTCVVQGGTDIDVATAIYNNRGIGCNTQGATVPTMTIIAVTDPNSGNITNIGFVRPTIVPIFVGLTIQGLTAAFNSAVQAQVIAAVVAYLNELQIGEAVLQSSLYGAALSVMPNPLQPIFSIRSVTLGLTATSILAGHIGASGGTGYVGGDIGTPLTVVQGGASGGTFLITAVVGGAVTAVAPVAATIGTGYSVANNLATTGGTGTGAQIDITSVQPSGTSDLAMAFYKVASGITANVTLGAE